MPTLEELADQGHVYLDGSVLSQDRNPAEFKRQPFLSNLNDFGDLSGAAHRFRDVPYARIQRQARFASRLAEATVPRPAIRSVPRIVAEYKVLVRHLERSLTYFRDHSVGKRSMKEVAYMEVVDAHQHISGVLDARSCEGPEMRTLAEFLYNNKLHLPRDGVFVKKNEPPEYPSPSKVTLVAGALLEATAMEIPVAIISNDHDVFNLVHNMSDIFKRSIQIAHVKCGPIIPVTVYRPAQTRWREDLCVEFTADTKGQFAAVA